MNEYPYITYKKIPCQTSGITPPLDIQKLCNSHDAHLKKITLRNKALIPSYIYKNRFATQDAGAVSNIKNDGANKE